MKPNLPMSIIFPLMIVCCGSRKHTDHQSQSITDTIINPYSSIGAIPMPAGYSRVPTVAGSFGQYLRNLRLKKDRIVYLYNGNRKLNQHAQFAVIDMSVGTRDLQQCADAIMRLRAEYLYAAKKYSAIHFSDNNGTIYALGANKDRIHFDGYLDKVFSRCGTLSLEKELMPVGDIRQVRPGDVLIHGGSPGHAMLVVDMAVNTAGRKIYMLSQGYMPAQDIHIVINPGNPESPWYELKEGDIATPEYYFTKGHFRTWP